jgi:6-phosphogluconolactonase
MSKSRHVPSRGQARFISLCAAGVLAAVAPAYAAAAGAVYVQTNQATGNAVVVFDRAADGTLTYRETVPTGGTGTIVQPPPNGAPGIDPLGSQGSVVYADGLLLAVNAGSNDVSVFRADEGGLQLQQRISSGGTMPVSVTLRGGLAYVVNGGGTPSVSGFRVDHDARQLHPLAGSARALPGGTGAAPGEVALGPDDETLVVTEKGTGKVDVFRLDERGVAGSVATIAAPGVAPFGFAITRRSYVLVSEAGSGSVTSYDLSGHGAISVISPAVSLAGQTAPCWLVATPDGRQAFTGNAGTQAISTLGVGADGTLTLLNATAASLGASALDLGLTADGHTLYVRGAQGANASLPETVSAYQVQKDGSLTLVGTAGNLPPGSQGMAVR